MGKTWKDYIGITALFVFFITLSIAIVILFTPMYSWVAQYLGIADSLGMSHEQLMDNYHTLIQYLNVPWIDELVLPDFESSSSGLFHFYEVKRLFFIDYALLLISAIISFFFLKQIKESKRGFILKTPLKIMGVLPIILSFILALNFNWLFTVFHELLFDNDAWLFNPATDPIILALPEEFFMICFVVVFLLFELGVFFTYRFAKKHSYIQ